MERNSLNEAPYLSFIVAKAQQETAFATIWLNEPIHSSFCLTWAASVSWAHPVCRYTVRNGLYR